MKFTNFSAALISSLIAFSGATSHAAIPGVINCKVLGVRFGTGPIGKVAPVLDSKEYNKSCALFEDPEFGFVGDCSFKVGRVNIAVTSINIDLELTTEIAPIKVSGNGSESVGLTLWDARHNTQHTVLCSIRR